MEQGKVGDVRSVVRINEYLESCTELKAVLMQIPGGDRIVTGQSFGKRRINSQLLLRLGDIDKTRAGPDVPVLQSVHCSEH